MKNLLALLLIFVSLNSFSQEKKLTEEIKDKNGHLIAKIKTKSNGIKEIHDKSGHYLGQYDPKKNITNNKNGHLVGKGNLLITLLK